MQYGGDPQAGGFLDPGTAALIAAILSGGVGFYGYTKSGDTQAEQAARKAAAAVGGIEQLKKKAAEADELRRQRTAEAVKVQNLTLAISNLKAEKEAALKKVATSSPEAMTFKNASPDALKAAIRPTIVGLKEKYLAVYPWLKDSPLSNLEAELAYPAGYSARLARMSLLDFYEKRIRRAAEDDYTQLFGSLTASAQTPGQGLYARQTPGKGGRRRRYRRKVRGGELPVDPAAQAQLNAFLDTQGEGEQDISKKEARRLEAQEARSPSLTVVPQQTDSTAVSSGPAASENATERSGLLAKPGPPGFSFPSYEEFIAVYVPAIQSAKVNVRGQIVADQTKKAEAKEAAKVKAQEAKTAAQKKKDDEKTAKQNKKDDEAAKKAAEELSKKFEKARTDAETKVLKAQITAQTLGLEDAVEAKKATYEEAKKYVDVFVPPKPKEGGAFSLFKSKADLTTIEKVQGPWTAVRDAPAEPVGTAKGEWDKLKEPALKLLDQYKAAADEYVAAVDDAKKAAKKGFALESRKLFELPKYDWAPSNPFAGILKALSESEDQAKALAENQALMKESIEFIKAMVKKAEKVLPELKDFGYAVEEAKDAPRGRAPTRIGRDRRTGGADTPLCADIKQDDGYTKGDFLWFYVNIRAILNGGVLKAKDTTIEWVEDRVPDPFKKASPRTALKFLLARLDTGFLSGTKTWFRGVFGRMSAPAKGEQSEASAFLENATLAGEAFVTLKCLVDKAVLLVNEEIKNDSVAKKNARLAKRNAEISKGRAEIAALAEKIRVKMQEDIAQRQQTFDTLQKQVIDASAALMPYTRSTGEGGRSTTPQQADDLKTAQKWLQDVNGKLETFRTGTPFQTFMKLGDQDIPADEDAIDRIWLDFKSQKAPFAAVADEVYREAKLALQNAQRLSQDVPALSKELEAIAPSAPGQFSAEGSKDFTMVNPMFKAKSPGSESATVLSAPGSSEAASAAATSNPQTPASSSPGTPVPTPSEEEEVAADEERKLKILQGNDPDWQAGRIEDIREETYAKLTPEQQAKWNRPLPGTGTNDKYFPLRTYDVNHSYLRKRKPSNRLQWSVRENDIQGIKESLAEGADPNKRDASILRKGSETVYRELADREPSVFLNDPPIFRVQSLEAARLLLEAGAKVNVVESDKYTPLHVALNENHPDIALALIEAGADVTAKDVDERTPLHMGGLTPELVKTMIDKGADINAKDKYGRTPLWRLVERHDGPSIRALLQNNASVNVTGPMKLRDGTKVPQALFSDLVSANAGYFEKEDPETLAALNEALRNAEPSSGLVAVVSNPVPETPGLTVPGRAAELKAATEAETALQETEAKAKADKEAAGVAERAALVPNAPSGAPNIVGRFYQPPGEGVVQPPKARPLTSAPSIPVPSGPPPVRPPPTRTVTQIEKDIQQAVNAITKFSKGEGNVANGNVSPDILNKSEELDKRLNQLEAELKVAKEAEAAKRKGGRTLRKSTFKRRRGGKQNGRRTRRGKNRANRSHSNSRRRT
jgi:hypothetical protein